MSIQNGNVCVQYGSINQNEGKNEDFLPDPAITRTGKYWYRWYICFIFSFFGFLQGAVWNTWSPIDKSAECALGFTTSDIALLANWGAIIFLLFMPLLMWVTHRKGLRITNVTGAFLVASGTALRCIPLPVHILRYFIHVGQILNSVAGCIVAVTPPLLSNVWFPPEERFTATAVATLTGYLGAGIAYITGPLMVREPIGNGTGNGIWGSDAHEVACDSSNEKHVVRNEIQNLMYVEFGICLVVFIAMLAFFPKKPALPPSASASAERMGFMEGLLALRHRGTFIIVAITFSLTTGTYGGWIAVLAIMLAPLGVSQNKAGHIGFFMMLIGCITGIGISWFADRIRGRAKWMIVAAFVFAFLGYLYYMIMSGGYIHVKMFEFSNVGLWAACIIIGISIKISLPLGMEMGVDAAYPTSEAVSSSVINWLSNLFGCIVVTALQFSSVTATNYLALAFVGVSIPLTVFFAEEQNNRASAQTPLLSTAAADDQSEQLYNSGGSSHFLSNAQST